MRAVDGKQEINLEWPYVKEIERLNGTCELAVYRALEKERNKWEGREARWLSEYSHRGDRHDEAEATRSRGDMSERAGIPTSAHSLSSSPSATASAQLSPVAFSMNVQEDSTRAVSEGPATPKNPVQDCTIFRNFPRL